MIEVVAVDHKKCDQVGKGSDYKWKEECYQYKVNVAWIPPLDALPASQRSWPKDWLYYYRSYHFEKTTDWQRPRFHKNNFVISFGTLPMPQELADVIGDKNVHVELKGT